MAYGLVGELEISGQLDDKKDRQTDRQRETERETDRLWSGCAAGFPVNGQIEV